MHWRSGLEPGIWLLLLFLAIVVVVGLAIVGAKHAFDCMLTDETSDDDCMFVWISMASLRPLTTCLIVGLFIPNGAMLITAISATFHMLSSM